MSGEAKGEEGPWLVFISDLTKGTSNSCKEVVGTFANPWDGPWVSPWDGPWGYPWFEGLLYELLRALD